MRRNLKRVLFVAMVVVSAMSVVTVSIVLCHRKPTVSHNRVQRRHSDVVKEEFRYLTKRYRVDDNPVASAIIHRWQAEHDLDECEWLLENRYAYIQYNRVDYHAALDSIRCVIGDGISRGDFVVQLRKLMCLFGDGHSGVKASLEAVFRGYLPFHIKSTRGGFVAVGGDDKWLDPEYPFVVAIDGVEVTKWLDAARQTVPMGSQQLVKMMSLIRLRHLAYLRQELSLPASDTVTVQLGASDGRGCKSLTIPVDRQLNPAPRKVNISSEINGEIGYLRIPAMLEDEEFLASIRQAVSSMADTRAIIIDVRGNPGGSRAPLLELFPLLARDERPCVVNVAKFRNGTDVRPATRWLYPYDSKCFGIAERNAINTIQNLFQPEWPPPEEKFGPWHYMVLPGHSPSTAPFKGPIAVLMDGANFSATDVFLAAFKGRTGVTLIGEPSGGGSGYALPYVLQYSQIGIRLSSMASFRPNGQLYDGKGIEPDVYRCSEPEDLNGKSDNVLNYARQILLDKLSVATPGADRLP
jgi:C-terminal processing protease CtpA/Prc